MAEFVGQELTCIRGERVVFAKLAFSIDEGEVLYLQGPNGSGKSTLLRLMAGLMRPVSGELLWNGESTRDDPEAFRGRIHYVGHQDAVKTALTVEENLKLAQIAEPRGWAIERIYEYFPRLAERRTQEGITLSGGEQQMLAFARALARDIKLLMLDEPFEGLAPLIRKEITKIVLDIKKLGITTIIVEQDAMAVLKLADRAIILDMGKVVFNGTAEEVRTNKEMREQYLAV